MSESIPLTGGRITPGVVRIGNTVRRPTKDRTPFVRSVLEHLEQAGFDAAPRFLGVDEQGRETLSFREGRVPENIQPDHGDHVLRAAGRLIRRYHDATAESPLAREEEVVCHNDLSPCNFVFQEGLPVALIDFDAAAPGLRLEDIAYAIFLWLDLGASGPPPAEQGRRTRLFSEAYGLPDVPSGLVDEILRVQRRTAVRLESHRADGPAEWWREQATWLERNRNAYEAALA